MSFKNVLILSCAVGFVALAIVGTGIEDAYEEQSMYSGISKNKYPEKLTTEMPLGQYEDKTEGVMTFDLGEVVIRNSIEELFRKKRLTLKYFDFTLIDNRFLESSFYICSEARCEKVVGLSEDLKVSVSKSMGDKAFETIFKDENDYLDIDN